MRLQNRAIHMLRPTVWAFAFFALFASCVLVGGERGFAGEAGGAEKEPAKLSVFGKGTIAVPVEFERTQPANRMIEDEFVAKAGEGDDAKTARLYMMPSGGSVQLNVDRWKSQFAGGAEDSFKTESMKVGNWDVIVAEAAGTYSERMGGGPFAPGRVVKRPDYGMLAAIVVPPAPGGEDVSPDRRQKYFVKMIGPQEVIEANREAFLGMLKGLKE